MVICFSGYSKYWYKINFQWHIFRLLKLQHHINYSYQIKQLFLFKIKISTHKEVNGNLTVTIYYDINQLSIDNFPIGT